MPVEGDLADNLTFKLATLSSFLHGQDNVDLQIKCSNKENSNDLCMGDDVTILQLAIRVDVSC